MLGVDPLGYLELAGGPEAVVVVPRVSLPQLLGRGRSRGAFRRRRQLARRPVTTLVVRPERPRWLVLLACVLAVWLVNLWIARRILR